MSTINRIIICIFLNIFSRTTDTIKYCRTLKVSEPLLQACEYLLLHCLFSLHSVTFCNITFFIFFVRFNQWILSWFASPSKTRVPSHICTNLSVEMSFNVFTASEQTHCIFRRHETMFSNILLKSFLKTLWRNLSSLHPDQSPRLRHFDFSFSTFFHSQGHL